MIDGVAVRLGEPLARHTALRTGGPVDCFVVAHDEAALTEVLTDLGAARWPWRALGAGTRTVPSDAPLRGAVVRLGTGFQGVEVHGDVVRVGAGAAVGVLRRVAETHGLGGLHRFESAVGSVGASVVCDAGWQDRILEARGWTRGRVGPVAVDAVARCALLVEVTLRLPARRGRARAGLRGATLTGGDDLRATLRAAPLDEARLRGVGVPSAAPELLVNFGAGTSEDLRVLHRAVRERVERRLGRTLETRLVWW